MRTGIICPGEGLRAWQRKCVDLVAKLDFVELCLVIVDGDAIAEAGPQRGSLANRLRRSLTPGPLRFVGLTESLSTVPTAALLDGQAASALVRELAIDLVICFSPRPVPGNLVSAPTFGVWRHCIGAGADGGGDPPCLEEIREERHIVEIRLLRLTGKDCGGEILKEAAVQTVKRSYRATLAAAVSAAAHLPAQVCIEIKKLGKPILPARRFAIERCGKHAPMARRAVSAMGKMLKHRIRWLAHGVSMSEEWTLGIVDRPVAGCLEDDFLREPRFIPTDKAHYLADGFGLVLDGRNFVLCEQFDYAAGRGAIAWLELDSDGRVLAGPTQAFNTTAHASYPYLFSHCARVFCCPETWESGSLSLWEAVNPPAVWRCRGKVLAGVPAVDPVIFRHGGLWWLFCSREDDQPNEKLYGWYAEGLAGPWWPHELNPLKIDVRSARSAGAPFLSDGLLYRPAQDCSRAYGTRISINRVTQLSPSYFSEEVVRVIDPPRTGRFQDGIHTIAPLGDVCLIDARRWQLSPRGLRLKIRKLLAPRSSQRHPAFRS